MIKQSKIKLIFSIIILSLIMGGLVLPSGFVFAQSYIVDLEGYYLLAWGTPPEGIPTRINYIERSINLPYYGRYEVRTYYNANSGQDQLYEEFKVLVDGKYIGQTSDPNLTSAGPDYENEYLGEHYFTAGNHQVRLEHAWNYADVGAQSVHLENVVFTLKEIFAPELSLSKSVNKSTAQEGEILTYILSYQNTGKAAATGVVISDDYDENYLDIYDNGGGTVSGGEISWNISTLGEGSSGTKIFKVKVKDELPEGITYIYNKAVINSTQTEPSESNIVSTKVTINNNPPVANAGPDKELYEEQSIILAGSGSDPDGDPITYYWTCTGGSLFDRYLARPTFTAPYVSYDRTYTCTLTVTDDEGLNDSDSMTVTVRNETVYNRPPVANAGPDKEVYENGSVVLNGSGSDPDGDPLSYRWTCTDGYLSNRYIIQPTFTAPYVSYDRTYTCTLTVTDDEGLNDSDSMTVTVRNETVYNRPPIANAGPDKEVYEGQSKIFDSSGWDPDGDPVTYYWSCTGGYLSSRYIARPTFTAPQVSYDRTYSCTLTVSDDKGLSDSDSMIVSVPGQESVACPKTNSSCSNPNGYIYLGDTKSGCLNDSDWKYYKIRQSSGKKIKIEVNWSGTGCSLNDLYIYSSGCSQIYSQENNSWSKTWEGTPSSDIIVGLDGDSSNDNCQWSLKTIRAGQARLSIQKSVKNISRGDTKWYNSYRSANPSDKLLFRLVIKATGDTKSENVRVKDTLPSKIIYQGDLEIDGVSNSRNITETAVNIGNLSPGESKTITFEAKVASKGSFSYGTTELINTARAYTSEISDTDTIKVIVTRKAVAGVVTTISTGITNGILNSILLPLVITLLIVWIFRSKLVGLDKWAQKRKKEIGEYRAEKTLKRKIAQLKSKGVF